MTYEPKHCYIPLWQNAAVKSEQDVEHLDLNIDWSALTEEEQQTLHGLLSKAHQGYLNNNKKE